MKLIPPSQISGSIMTIIDESISEIYIISPYVEISNWTKMKNCLERALKRNVKINFVTRKDTNCNLSPIRKLGIEILKIENLHTKLYLNESAAVITSQNLTQYSDDNSIDIGHYTNDQEQINNLKNYIKNYITPSLGIKKTLKFDYLNTSHSFPIIFKHPDFFNLNFINKKIKENFTSKNIALNERYIFIKNFIVEIDIFMSFVLTIGIDTSWTCRNYKQKIENLEFPKLNYEYKVTLYDKSDVYKYITYETEEDFQLQKLINDYIIILKCIEKI